jgi:DNA primase
VTRSADLQARKDRVADGLLAVVQRRVAGLRKAGPEFKACCPFHDERTASFHVIPAKHFAHCFGCGWNGRVIDFVMAFDGLGFLDALARIEGELGFAELPANSPSTDSGRAVERRDADRPAIAQSDFVSSRSAGIAVWRGAEGIDSRGTLVEKYLRARGIDPFASAVMDVVRFLPRCPTGLWRKGENWRDARHFAPAMLLPIVRVTRNSEGRLFQEQHGVEVVFLAPDGSGKMVFPERIDRDGKRHRPPSRKIWGELQGGAVPVPPLGWKDWRDPSWIERVSLGPELVIAEGFESTLSLLARRFLPVGAFATLSLDNLQGRWLTTKRKGEEALALYAPEIDPSRRVFTIPGVERVVIGVDADMKPLKNRRIFERPGGPAVERDLTGFERMQLCAALAAQHWRRAGSREVAIARPAMGKDFNDYDKAAVAGKVAA